MELYGCLKLSVPKNVATKEPVDLHFITLTGAATIATGTFYRIYTTTIDFMHTSDILRLWTLCKLVT